jgi:hypothetical protein
MLKLLTPTAARFRAMQDSLAYNCVQHANAWDAATGEYCIPRHDGTFIVSNHYVPGITIASYDRGILIPRLYKTRV